MLDEVTIVSTAGLSAHSAGQAAVQLARAEARLAGQLEKEEQDAAQGFLEMHDYGDGTTHGRFAIPTLAGDMLRTALNAFASPRRPDGYERYPADGSHSPVASTPP